MPTLATIVDHIPQVLGWIGMVLLLVAFARKDTLSKRRYALMNLVGAILVGVSALEQQAWPPLALEVAWAGIALRDLLRVRARESA
jgi:hypothetical protein